MRKLRTCRHCRHGIRTAIGEAKEPAVVCAFSPPKLMSEGNYHRPVMLPLGWCGQFKFGLSNLLSRSYG